VFKLFDKSKKITLFKNQKFSIFVTNRERFLIILVVTAMLILDTVFIYQLLSSNRSEMEHEYINSAETLEYVFKNSVDTAGQLGTTLSMSRDLDVFLETNFESTSEYYDQYSKIVENTHLSKVSALNKITTEIYSDNDSIINGGGIYRMSSITDSQWYKTFVDSGEEALLVFLYDPDTRRPNKCQRNLYYIRWLRYYPGAKCKKLVKMEIDYTTLCTNIERSLFDVEVYLCQGDEIVISSSGNNNRIENFTNYSVDSAEYSNKISFSGNEFTIAIPKSTGSSVKAFRKNTVLTFVLLVVNFLFPLTFIRLGHMVQEGKIKEQEMDIARQNAELLALHSQINPHFLFNALESIRMHSLLRGEEETAEMVEMLAVIERKNADWNEDETTIKDEMTFVEAYLKLQQYRFGERLSYEIDVSEDCERIKIPRLTIVTFVENACVHGIEGKSSPGWIFVNVYKKNDNLYIEVEDTGGGMSEEDVEDLNDKMRNASLEKLKTKGRIGVINACLRLKMYSNNKVLFDVDSETGVGTTVQVQIPLEVIYK